MLQRNVTLLPLKDLPGWYVPGSQQLEAVPGTIREG